MHVTEEMVKMLIKRSEKRTVKEVKALLKAFEKRMKRQWQKTKHTLLSDSSDEAD